MDSNFPLKVACPACFAAIGAKCTEPHWSRGSSRRFVDWFHFERTGKAKEQQEPEEPFFRQLDRMND